MAAEKRPSAYKIGGSPGSLVVCVSAAPTAAHTGEYVMSNAHKAPETLRSARWFGPDDLRSFGHRSRIMQMGYAPEDWEKRPIIAILNTWSGINPCHAHFKDRVEDVKRGILQAGGFPMELPTLSLSENFVKPTTMLYRNM